MKARAIRTKKVTSGSCTISHLLDESLDQMPERSVLVITSKIVSLCEGATLPKEGTDLNKLVQDEAEWFMVDAKNQHGYISTIAHNILTPNSGVDESNSDGNYVLWPACPQRSANQIRRYLVERFSLHEVAVIIADSSFVPLRWGSMGFALAHSGIEPLRRYYDELDLFGRPLLLSRTNVVDSLATTATFLMGEGAEQTPLAIIQDIPNVEFLQRDPTPGEIAARHTPPEEDSFGPILTAVEWKPGGFRPQN